MAEGDIGAVIDSLTFDAVYGVQPNIIHIDGNIYAIAYSGPDYDGWIKTVEIADDGTLPAAVEDSFEFDTDNTTDPKIVHVKNNIYAIAYQGGAGDGWITTVEIALDGTITTPVKDTFEFDDVMGYYIALIKITDGVFGIAYQGPDLNSFVCTVLISATGIITDPVKDSFEHDTGWGTENSITHVAGNVYAIAYSGGGYDGWLHTVEIAAGGEITEPIIDNYEWQGNDVTSVEIIHISGHVFAISFTNTANEGRIKTVEIADDGTITTPFLHEFTYNAGTGQMGRMIHVSGTFYAIVFTGPDSDGWIKTVEIADDGTFPDPTPDSLEFDATYCNGPDIIHVAGDTYAIAYAASAGVGVLLTIDIDTVLTSGEPHLMMMGLG